jgi:gamma-glutamyltranspeptidase / glutathione hydrolase
LLSKEYAAERRKLIDPKRATVDPKRGTPVASSNTVYLSVVDGMGQCLFVHQQQLHGLRHGNRPERLGKGFTLQNRGHNFSLDPDHPNCLAPGKRPYHTIIPAMVTRAEADNSLYASYGVMGGFMQPQGHVQVLSALHDAGLDPQSALDLPRFCIDVDEWRAVALRSKKACQRKHWMPCKRWDIQCMRSQVMNACCSAGDR